VYSFICHFSCPILNYSKHTIIYSIFSIDEPFIHLISQWFHKYLYRMCNIEPNLNIHIYSHFTEVQNASTILVSCLVQFSCVSSKLMKKKEVWDIISYTLYRLHTTQQIFLFFESSFKIIIIYKICNLWYLFGRYSLGIRLLKIMIICILF